MHGHTYARLSDIWHSIWPLLPYFQCTISQRVTRLCSRKWEVRMQQADVWQLQFANCIVLFCWPVRIFCSLPVIIHIYIDFYWYRYRPILRKLNSQWQRQSLRLWVRWQNARFEGGGWLSTNQPLEILGPQWSAGPMNQPGYPCLWIRKGCSGSFCLPSAMRNRLLFTSVSLNLFFSY